MTVLRSCAGMPTETVTFLLTDVEGSTRAWVERPQETSAAIERIELLTSTVVQQQRGTVVKSRGEGDSAFCVFPSPSDALAAAVDLAVALLASPLRVRMAVHTGEAEHRDGDWFGLAPSRCARLRNLAVGGQIVCSQVTADTAALPPGVTLSDLGSTRLAGLPSPEQVFQVCHPMLPAEFPPLRAGSTNVPASYSSFVGRDEELERLSAAIDSSRLVTLTGSGGCGKSRLAVETVRGFDRPGGVWFADLAAVADNDLVAQAVGRALGLTEQSEAALIERLHPRPALVVLDNCEHLIDAAAALADQLLRACPDLHIVATSREPLGIVGEVIWRVGPLASPTAGAPVTAEHAAVRLFVDRAAAVRPGFTLTDANRAAVGEICRRLDGIPLAIELATARVASMSTEQIAAGLDDRFRLLTSGGRMALSRQRTLEASVDWSYELLTDHQRAVLSSLAVFAGSFSVEAAEAVCASQDALEVIGQLVDRSLVVLDDTAQHPRYRLLDTIRHYAQRKLIDRGALDVTLERHVAYYAERSTSILGTWDGGGAVSFEWIVAEMDNLRAAADRARTTEDHDALLAISLPMNWTLSFTGPWLEFRDRMDQLVLDVPSALANPHSTAIAMHLLSHSSVADDNREPALMWDGYEALVDAMPDGSNKAFTQSVAGIVASYGRSIDAGRALNGDAARQFAEEISQPACSAFGLHAYTEWAFGDLRVAATACERALGISRQLGASSIGETAAVSIAAWLAWAACDVDRAEQMAIDAIERHRTPVVTMWASTLLAAIALGRGDVVAARDIATEVARSSTYVSGTRLGDPPLMATVLLWERNVDAASASLSRFTDVHPRSFVDDFEPLRVLDVVEIGIAANAVLQVQTLSEALEAIAAPRGHRRATAAARLARARLARHHHDPVAAADLSRRALADLIEVHARMDAIEALDSLGGALIDTGDVDRGARLMGAAAGARARSGLVERPSHVRPIVSADADRVRGSASWVEGTQTGIEDAAGYARRGRGRRRTASIGWEALTPAEHDVVDLAAAGLSNAEIGERLFISRRTAQTHLSHAFAKLGVATRAELAAASARRTEPT